VSQRALSFGAVAAAYERFRPGYPDEVVGLVLAYAGRPVRTALEIGAGTGKATRLFARTGVALTATDPDAAMLSELRKQVPDTLTTVQAAFEDLPLTPAYDLVFAAASLHWTRPEGRWERVAGMLAPAGIFASFGGQRELADPEVRDRVETVRSTYLEDDDIPSPDGTPADRPMQWPGTELAASTLFVDVRQSTLERRTIMSSDDYVGHLSTVSAYLQLPEPIRREALDAIREVLPPRVEMVGDLQLHLARLGAYGHDPQRADLSLQRAWRPGASSGAVGRRARPG
jgi:SAM-dependent methyltransferase